MAVFVILIGCFIVILWISLFVMRRHFANHDEEPNAVPLKDISELRLSEETTGDPIRVSDARKKLSASEVIMDPGEAKIAKEDNEYWTHRIQSLEKDYEDRIRHLIAEREKIEDALRRELGSKKNNFQEESASGLPARDAVSAVKLQQSCDALTAENYRLRQEIGQRENKIAELQKEILSHKTERDAVESEIQIMRVRENEISMKYQQELRQTEDLRQQAADLQSQIERERDSVSRWEENAREWENKNKEWVSQRESLENEYVRLRETADAQAERIRAEYQDRIDGFQRRIKEMQGAEEELNACLARAEQEQMELRRRISESDQENADMAGLYEELKQASELLRQEVDEKTNRNMELAVEVTELRAQLNARRNSPETNVLDGSDSRYQKIRAKLRHVRDTILSELRAKEQALQDAEKIIVRLSQKSKLSDSSSEDSTQWQQEKNTLEDKIRRMNYELIKLRAQNAGLERICCDLKTRVENAIT